MDKPRSVLFAIAPSLGTMAVLLVKNEGPHVPKRSRPIRNMFEEKVLSKESAVLAPVGPRVDALAVKLPINDRSHVTSMKEEVLCQ